MGWQTYNPDDWDIDGRNSAGEHYSSKEGSFYPDYCSDSEPSSYKFQFKTEEELVSSVVFQRQLTKAIAFKDKIIAELQAELLKSVI